MEISTSAEIKTQLESIKGKTFEGYKPLLEGIGIYLHKTLPSAVENDYILRVEVTLNDLYVEIEEKSWSADLEEDVLQALGLASQLSRAIKIDSGGKYNDEFFVTIKRLGKTLQLISNSY